MSDYQAQTVTECLSTWCTLTAGHNGDHTDLREPRTAREELARIIRDGVGVWRTPLEAADAILGAVAPREVTTAAELGALPVGTRLLGREFRKGAPRLWRIEHFGVVSVERPLDGICGFAHFIDPLPATILYSPAVAE